MFITIEGCEGVGKSTLLRNLVERLSKRGVDVVATREPGGSSLGTELRKFLLLTQMVPKAETLFFLGERCQHLEELIEPALQSGKVVICDRFHDSTIAYQGFGRGLGGERIERLCWETCGDRWPDLTFWIDLDPALALERARRESGGSDRFEDQKLQFHHWVNEGFRSLASRFPKRIVTLDGCMSEERLAAKAEEYIVQSPDWK